MKKILLISYTFPPKSGIGGRRWAKFAKYLAKDGHEIYVICARPRGAEKSQWMSDVQSPNIHVFERDARFPEVLEFGGNSFAAKLKYRMWTWFLKIYSSGRLYDRAVFWEKDLIAYSEHLIKLHDITNVICTIPPYRLAYITAKLKSRNPKINFVLDFRDPWTNNETFHEFKHLSKKRRAAELEMEKFSIQQADLVVSTTNQMTAWAKEKTTQPEKCITISNGYDEDDVFQTESSGSNGSKKLVLFAGNLYGEIEYVFIPFLNVISEMEKKDPSFSSRIHFEFYGNITSNIKSLCEKYKLNTVSLHGFIPIDEIRQKYKSANAFMMYSVADHAFAFNTKFFEYASYRKPILHFSNDGEVSRFIETHGIGTGLSPENTSEILPEVLNSLISDKLKFNADFNLAQFSIKHLTKQVEALLK
ncbi:MAG: glycosyl transferase family 1 [Bacteroidetes bacterium]|nr:glycosyl transferase family 1 [Bacteroidota bacterium]